MPYVVVGFPADPRDPCLVEGEAAGPVTSSHRQPQCCQPSELAVNGHSFIHWCRIRKLDRLVPSREQAVVRCGSIMDTIAIGPRRTDLYDRIDMPPSTPL